MFERFADYMYYLLTTPFKKVSKKMNQWYILFKVLGCKFDDAMEGIHKAREETMLATCSEEMLQVHAHDRNMTMYYGEMPENFRKRIANYTEVCRMGGTSPGVLLAVESLGYSNPVIKSAKNLTGDMARWAEFYLIIVMNVDEEHPITFEILRKEVRKAKEVGAKDNYLFQYISAVRELNSTDSRVSYRKIIRYWKYKKLNGEGCLDGTWNLDSTYNQYPTCVGYRYKDFAIAQEISNKQMEFYYVRQQESEGIKTVNCYMVKADVGICEKLDGSHQLDGTQKLNAYKKAELKTSYRMTVQQISNIGKTIYHKEHNLNFLNGESKLDGSKVLDAYEVTEVI